MSYPLRCRCGAFEGYIASPEVAARALCYCSDCQAFARFLGNAARGLNAHGGTDIIATLPRHVHFTRGRAHLACMSLSERGLLRWYAACCRTPIGNTPRDPKLPYVGVARACLTGSDDEVATAFGKLRAAINTDSATGRVRATPLASFFALLRIMRNVLSARFTGVARQNPFFRPGGNEPVVAPQVLTGDERRALHK